MAKKEPDKYYFVEKAKVKFDNKYTYDMESWVSNKEKLRIFCPQHGEFFQTPTAHATGNGCPNCYYASRHQKGEVKFFKDAQRVHGALYDYSKTLFVNKTTKMIIICKLHGEFVQDAACHINQKQGCPTCGAEKCVQTRKLTYNQEWFLQEAKGVHGDYYRYEKVRYENAHKSVIITCPEHGDFKQKPSVHLNGSGCRVCGITRRAKASQKGLEQWVKEALDVHGDKYDYSKSVYLGNNHKITVTCLEHGDFSMRPIEHLTHRGGGRGCPKCSDARSAKLRSGNTEDFVKKAQAIHGAKYEYVGNYLTSKDKFEIICPLHGSFMQNPNDHLGGHGCVKCSNQISQFETKIEGYLKSLNVVFKKGDRTGVAGYGKKHPLELDFYLPEHNLGIEINGEWWHSSQAKDKTWDWVKNHQKIKADNCESNGVQLLHFYTEEIENRFEQVKGIISAKLGVLSDAIAARKTLVKDLDWGEAKDFQNTYHLQGASTATKSKGLFFNGGLVAMMVFGRLKTHRGNTDQSKYELIRYCSSTRVIGGCSKLMKAFIKETPDCKTVVSYSDNRHSNGKMYGAMGFELVKESPPDYAYITDETRVRKHKSNFRRAALAKMLPNFDPNLTERENCHLAGYYQLFDAGKKRWELMV